MNIKNIILTALLGVSVIQAASAVKRDVFSELTQDPQIESTYVSGKFGTAKKWYSSNGERAINLNSRFTDLYSYQCYSEDAVKKARSILDEYLKSESGMDMVMQQKRGQMLYEIYEKFLDENRVERMIIWNQDASNVCEVVVINWEDWKPFDDKE